MSNIFVWSTTLYVFFNGNILICQWFMADGMESLELGNAYFEKWLVLRVEKF